MCIFGIGIGVPTLKGLCNLSCSGSCSFDGFDLACNCQVPLNATNVKSGMALCGDIDHNTMSQWVEKDMEHDYHR